jgi:hypothetical protein
MSVRKVLMPPVPTISRRPRQKIVWLNLEGYAQNPQFKVGHLSRTAFNVGHNLAINSPSQDRALRSKHFLSESRSFARGAHSLADSVSLFPQFKAPPVVPDGTRLLRGIRRHPQNLSNPCLKNFVPTNKLVDRISLAENHLFDPSLA